MDRCIDWRDDIEIEIDIKAFDSIFLLQYRLKLSLIILTAEFLQMIE